MNKALKNIFASALPQIINIVTNLILPAMIIFQFGSEMNGLVTTTKTIVAYISIVGAGIATVITQSLYAPVANNDCDEVRGLLRAASDMFNKYGVIYCGLTVIVAILFPFLITSDIDYLTIALLLVVMSVSGASEFFAIGRYRAILYAHQRVYVDTLVQAISLALSLILAITMLKLEMNIVIVQFAMSIVYVLRACVLTIYVRLVFPEYKGYRKVKPIKRATEKRNDALIHQISGLAVTGSQAAILTLIVDLKAASIFAVYNIIFSGLQSICANLNTAVSPFLGREIALNNREKSNALYNIIELGFNLLVAFVMSVSAFMILPFISVYTKGADINYIDYSFAAIFIYCSSFYILKMPSNSAINVAGHFKETKKMAIIEASLSIGLSIVFTYLFGKSGVIIGTGCALGWRCVDMMVYTYRKILITPIKTSAFRLVRTLIFIGFSITISYFMKIEVSGYFEWCEVAIVVSICVGFALVLATIPFESAFIKSIKNFISFHKKA